MRTTVGIIGAGPAGLFLSHLLHLQGIDSVVLERRDRAYCEARQRAGVVEHGAAAALRAAGVGERMDREGAVHDGVEFRFNGRGHRIDFQGLTGRHVVVYAQTEIVKDLIARRLADGGDLRFDTEATAIEDIGGDGTGGGGPARIRFVQGGREQVLDCDQVVACDGFHGIGRQALPQDRVRTFERTYPFSWLGILADAPPAIDELIYSRHARGFALYSMRTPEVSRLYLQVPNGTDPASWTHAQIWDELDTRLALEGSDWRPARGAVTDVGVTPMRSVVTEPMSHGRLFLAGDAAHIVPPTGAKGLNLALRDVMLLADALTAWHGGVPGPLRDYGATALRRVWRAEHFSWLMTSMLHVDPDASPFDHRMQESQLDYIASSAAMSASIAENYTGLPQI
ncbi:4-hydroxybenzoate 3-monooxygenase [Nocardiopsis coralliicola]